MKFENYLAEKKMFFIETWDGEFTVYPSKKSKKVTKHFSDKAKMMKWAEKENINLEQKA